MAIQSLIIPFSELGGVFIILIGALALFTIRSQTKDHAVLKSIVSTSLLQVHRLVFRLLQAADLSYRWSLLLQ